MALAHDDFKAQVSLLALLEFDDALEAINDQLVYGSAVIAVHVDGTVKRVLPRDWFDKLPAPDAHSSLPHNRGATDMQEQIDRVEAWAQTLIDGGAPHQQPLAQDAMVLVNHAKATTMPADGGPDNVSAYASSDGGPDNVKLADNVYVGDAVATVPKSEYDDLQAQLENAKEHIRQLVDDNVKLEQELETLTAPSEDEADEVEPAADALVEPAPEVDRNAGASRGKS